MSSYAGFQRSDVPNIGKDVSGILQHQLDTQAKEDAQQKALIAKGLANDQKLAKENEKSYIEMAKPLDKAVGELPLTDYEVINLGANKLVESTFAYTKSVKDNPNLTLSEKNRLYQGAASGVTHLNGNLSGLNAATKKVVEQGVNASPMTLWGFKNIHNRLGDYNNYDPDYQDNGYGSISLNLKDIRTGKNVLDGKITNTLVGLSSIPAEKYSDDWKKLVTDAGDISIMKPTKGGGTELLIDEENSPKFVNRRQSWINSLFANKTRTGNAMMALLDGRTMIDDPSNTYKVVFVDPNTTDEEKRKLMDEKGSTDGKDMLFVEAVMGEDGMPIANITSKQKDILEKSIKSDWNDLAKKEYRFNPANQTSGSGGHSSGNGNGNEISPTMKRVLAGDQRAIASMVDQIKHSRLSDLEHYHYNPNTGILTFKPDEGLTDEDGGFLVPEVRHFNLKNQDDVLHLMRLFDDPKARNVGKYFMQKGE